MPSLHDCSGHFYDRGGKCHAHWPPSVQHAGVASAYCKHFCHIYHGRHIATLTRLPPKLSQHGHLVSLQAKQYMQVM